VRALGLDIGEKRIGVAISDPAGRVATPLTVLEASRVLGDGRELARLVEEYGIGQLVVGLPLTLEGGEGPQATRVRSAARRLASFVEVPIDFADERLSSAEASRAMAQAGLDSRKRRGTVDMVAAALFLQTYLDAHASDNRMGTEE